MKEQSTGVFTTDLSLVVRSWDAWMVEVTGLSADAACGHPLLELYPDIEPRGLLGQLRRVAEDGSVLVLAPAFHGYLLPCPTVRPSPYFREMQQRVTLSPLRSGDAVAGVVVQIEDVTERRDEERRFGERLKSGDEGVRLRAIEEVAAGSRRADLLSEAFADESWRVRRSAAEAAAEDESEAAADVLIRLLKEQHRDLSVLNSAIVAVAGSRSKVLPRLLPLLREEDEDLRTYVALVLGLLGDAEAVPALVELLDDPSANVRFHVVEALGRLRDRRAVGPLLEIIQTRDFFLAPAALDAAAAIGDEGVVPGLLPLLHDDLMAPVALHAVSRLGGEEAVAPLVSLVEGPHLRADEVAEALAVISDRVARRGGASTVADLVRAQMDLRGEAAIIASYSSASASVRPAIVRVVGWLDSAEADRLLVNALGEAATRLLAAEGLVRRGGRAVDVLTAALGGLADDACAAAVVALGRMGSAEAVPALLALLDDRPELALTVVAALGSIGDRRALHPLLGLLDHPAPAVRQAAVGALNSIGHPETPKHLAAMVESPSPLLREAAARITCYFGYPGAFEAMLSLTKDSDENVRRAAVEHLNSFEDDRVQQRLREVLETDTPTVRGAAARALTLLGREEAAPLLDRGLSDSDLWVRYHAARSAASLGAGEVAGRLREIAASDPVVPVRIAAVAALGALADEASIPLLVRMTTGEAEPELAQEALRALVQIGGTEVEAHLLELLQKGSPGFDRVLLDAVAASPSPRLAAAALSIASSTDDADTFAAALAVVVRGRHGPDAVEEIARAAIRSPERRLAAVEQLADVGLDRLADLERLLDDTDPEIRSVAVEVLARVPEAAVLPLLGKALADPDPAVSRLARLVMDRFDLRQLARTLTATAVPTAIPATPLEG